MAMVVQERPGSTALVCQRVDPTIDNMSMTDLKAALKRQRWQVEAMATELRQQREVSEGLRSENASLRRDRDTMTQQLHTAREGIRSDAPLVKDIPEMKQTDPTRPHLRLPADGAMNRLASAMVAKAHQDRDMRAILDVLRLDDQPMNGSTADERRSLKKAFMSHNLSIDMWFDVCVHLDVFQALWELCVRGVDRRVKQRRSHSAVLASPVRILDGSTAKVVGNFSQMLWHDGRIETAAKWVIRSTTITPSICSLNSSSAASSSRPSSVSRMRPPGAISVTPHAGESDPEDAEGDADSDVDTGGSGSCSGSSEPVPAPPPLPSPPKPVDVRLSPALGTQTRQPIPQRSMRLVDCESDPEGEQDDDACACCGEPGFVTKCDGKCGKWFHWWCQRDSHQPDQDTWACLDCAPELDWAPLPDCSAETMCVVCHDRKPLTQFATSLPECACARNNNRVCAKCTCTIDFNAESYDQVRCPTCNMHKTSLKLRDGEVVNLVHRKDENGGCDDWVDVVERPVYSTVDEEEAEQEAALQAQRAARLKKASENRGPRLLARYALKGTDVESGMDTS